MLRKCLDIQIRLLEKDEACWLTRLKTITEHLNIDIMNCELHKVIASMFEQAKCRMMVDINDNSKYPKLRTYKTFKTDMRIEPYLNHKLSKSFYTSIARFRLSSHNLNIELGRHKRPYVPVEERICDKCNSGHVEDEIHCLLICTKWKNSRVKLIEVACECITGFLVLNHSAQFHKIMTSKDINLNFALGKFLYTALKINSQP